MHVNVDIFALHNFRTYNVEIMFCSFRIVYNRIYFHGHQFIYALPSTREINKYMFSAKIQLRIEHGGLGVKRDALFKEL